MCVEDQGTQWLLFRGQMKLGYAWSTHSGPGVGTGTLLSHQPPPYSTIAGSPFRLRDLDLLPSGEKVILLNRCHLHYSQPVLALLGLPSVLEHPREE